MRKTLWVLGGISLLGVGAYFLFRKTATVRNLLGRSLVPPPDVGDYVTTATKERAISAALGEWEKVVKEPQGTNWREIDKYIRSSTGLDWGSANADNLDSDDAYTANGQFSWCGAFQAWCWGNAGLRHDIRYSHMSSLYRLHRWSRGTKRIIPIEQIQRGDIVCLGPPGGPEYGRHMAMALAGPVGNGVSCIEGNATGSGPRGDRYEGVTKNIRPIAVMSPEVYRVLYGVRFLVGDLS